jgi:hypothetical protein
MPTVDHGVKHVRQELFNQYETMRKDRTLKVVNMTEVQTSIISERLSVLFWAVLCALTIHEKTRDIPVFEVEARLTWDVVNYYFYVRTGEPVSPRVLYACPFDGRWCADSEVLFRLERILSLSRNRIVDGTNEEDIRSQQENLAKEYYRLCSAQQYKATKGSYVMEEQALAALNQAARFARQITRAAKSRDDMAKTVKDRARGEPLRGKCDAIFVVPINDASCLPENDKGGALVKDLRALQLVQVAESSQKSPEEEKVEAAVANPAVMSNHLSPPSSSTASRQSARLAQIASSVPQSSLPHLTKDDKEYLSNPLLSSCTETLHISSNLTVASGICTEPAGLMLPTMVVEYKKMEATPMKALNQGRTYCVSAVTFLAALGIKAYPVFGLVTSGKDGSVILAWHSDKTEVSWTLSETFQQRDWYLFQRIYVMERNTRSFDITNPIQAFQYATFLIRLREQDRRLEDLFKGKRENVAKMREKPWTKTAQNDELGLKKPGKK